MSEEKGRWKVSEEEERWKVSEDELNDGNIEKLNECEDECWKNE